MSDLPDDVEDIVEQARHEPDEIAEAMERLEQEMQNRDPSYAGSPLEEADGDDDIDPDELPSPEPAPAVDDWDHEEPQPLRLSAMQERIDELEATTLSNEPNMERIITVLCHEFDHSRTRVEKALRKLEREVP